MPARVCWSRLYGPHKRIRAESAQTMARKFWKNGMPTDYKRDCTVMLCWYMRGTLLWGTKLGESGPRRTRLRLSSLLTPVAITMCS